MASSLMTTALEEENELPEGQQTELVTSRSLATGVLMPMKHETL